MKTRCKGVGGIVLGVAFSSGPHRELQVLGDSFQDTWIATASLHVTAVACLCFMQVLSQKVSGCLALITCDKESRDAGWCLALSKLPGGLLKGFSCCH